MGRSPTSTSRGLKSSTLQMFGPQQIRRVPEPGGRVQATVTRTTNCDGFEESGPVVLVDAHGIDLMCSTSSDSTVTVEPTGTGTWPRIVMEPVGV